MKIIKTIEQMRKIRPDLENVALIPTMGNLHQGHLKLITEAKKYTKNIVVSIFVNPIQFNEKQDFITYPRTIDTDIAKLTQANVAILFMPNEKELYPYSPKYFIEPDDNIQNQLCGQYRPNHFKAVATIVAKLFNIINPNIAIFGKKDYQQYIMIKNMVQELNFDIKIIGVDTIREENGLALSSRNSRLNPIQKKQAINLYITLQKIKNYILSNGLLEINQFIQNQILYLQKNNLKVDYLEIRQLDNLQNINNNSTQLIVLGALYIDNVRIIDNIPIIIQ